MCSRVITGVIVVRRDVRSFLETRFYAFVLLAISRIIVLGLTRFGKFIIRYMVV